MELHDVFANILDVDVVHVCLLLLVDFSAIAAAAVGVLLVFISIAEHDNGHVEVDLDQVFFFQAQQVVWLFRENPLLQVTGRLLVLTQASVGNTVDREVCCFVSLEVKKDDF